MNKKKYIKPEATALAINTEKFLAATASSDEVNWQIITGAGEISSSDIIWTDHEIEPGAKDKAFDSQW